MAQIQDQDPRIVKLMETIKTCRERPGIIFRLNEPYCINGRFLPEDTQNMLVDYVLNGLPPGGFGEALLSNDLMETFARADQHNLLYLTTIITWVTNRVPAVAHGSPERVRLWLKAHEELREQRGGA